MSYRTTATATPRRRTGSMSGFNFCSSNIVCHLIPLLDFRIRLCATHQKMDGVGIAASIVSIAGAGVQISIKLVTLATQMSTASERVSSIGNDISLTAGVLHQLGELMTQKTTKYGISIFSTGGLETTRTSATMCQRIFQELEKEARKASEQIRGRKRLEGGKIKLSMIEKAKWPFLQPSIDVSRADLREAKGMLMLMLQVTSLALSKSMAEV